jgi:capsular polysaccharide biosynthesis protein
MAESFFRRWPLYLLPLLLLIGVGVMQASRVTAQYRSVGVLNVASNPLLSDVSPLGGTGATSFETPSAATTRMINELLRTEVFVRSVAEHAGLKGALDTNLVTIEQIRARVGASSTGTRLLNVSASWTDATTAAQLVISTIDQYTDHVLQVQIKNSTEAETFYTNLSSGYKKALVDAQDALQNYVVAHPTPKIGERPAEQTLAMQALGGVITQAQTQLTNAENKIDEARLSTQQARSQTGDSLQLVDPPEVPTAPESIHRRQAMAVAVYLFLGVFIVVAMLLLSSLLDRAVRSADDIDVATGLAVVATVPSIAALSRRVEQRVTNHERRPAKA